MNQRSNKLNPGRVPHGAQGNDGAELPNDIAALWFACQCFDIGESMLKPISRPKLKRAREDNGIGEHGKSEVNRILWDRLTTRFRRHGVAPASVTNNFTDEATTLMLT